MTVIEICVDTTEGVKAARDRGADRVELCRELWCGGLTPDPDAVLAALPLAPPDGIQILVRSRPGNFVYTAKEIDDMCRDISDLCQMIDHWNAEAHSGGEEAHSGGAETRGGGAETLPYGFVVGALTDAHRIDVAAAIQFREAARGHRLTFHRAFDEIEDTRTALDTLVQLGYHRILTTGGTSGSADVEGLTQLVSYGAGRIVILASGGLRASNVAGVVEHTHAGEVHMRAPLTAGKRGGDAHESGASSAEGMGLEGAGLEGAGTAAYKSSIGQFKGTGSGASKPEGTDPEEVERIVRALRT